jgi:O-antigen/teichoic acid export membrane protein
VSTAADRPQRGHKLWRQFLRVFSVNVIGWPVALLLQMVLARTLGESDYGTFAYLFAMATVGAIFCRVGMDGAATRYVPSYLHDGEFAKLRGFLAVSSAICLTASILTGAALFALSLSPAASALRLTPWQALLTGTLIAAFAMFRLWQGISHALLRHAIAQTLEKLFLPAAILSIALLLTSGDINSADNILLAYIALGAVVTLILAIRCIHAMPAQSATHATRELAANWLAAGGAVVLMTGAQTLVHHTDIIMLGIFTGTGQVGFYNVAAILGQAPALGVTVANLIAGPRFATAIHAGETDALRSLIRFSLSAGALVALAGFVIIAAFGDWILALYGSGFVVAWPALVIIGAAMLGNVLCGSVGTLLVVSGNGHVAGRIAAQTAIINIALNAALIPLFGMNGAAFATATAIVTANLRMRYSVVRILGIEPSVWSFIHAKA